jgi:hypothetical protein
MNRKSKAKRRSRKRAPPEAQEAAARRAKSRRELRDKIAILVAAAIIIPVVVFTFLTFYRSDSGEEPPTPPAADSNGGPRAAIVDHLALTEPNPAFAEAATDLLEQAGYSVDYFPGEEVTVEFYRQLPSWGYDLVILRVHSAQGRVGDQPADWVTLFTVDPYDTTSYRSEQTKQRVSKVSYFEGGPAYFGVMPSFIKSSAKGNFQGATIIIMGCDGLITDTMAEAFVEKGAKAVVAWDAPVSSEHTDAATERLLQHLLIDKLALQEAVAQTMAEVGPDPSYQSVLRLYPAEEPVSTAP